MGDIQRSFASGEVSPALYGRPDVDRWGSALKTCRNWIVDAEGGLTVRQGFELKALIPYNAGEVRLIPFEYGPNDSCVIVSRQLSSNIVKNGSLVYGDAIRDESVSSSYQPWRMYVDDHGFTTGDTVKFYSGILAGTTYTITVSTPDLFTLNGTMASGTTKAGNWRREFRISGSAPIAAYPGLYFGESNRYVQSGDTLFIAGTSAPWKMVRNNYTGVDPELTFTSSEMSGYTPFPLVTTLSAVSSDSGNNDLRYRVTCTYADGSESTVVRKAPVTSTAISGTTKLTITSTAHGMYTNDRIQVATEKLDDLGKQIYKAGEVVRIVKVTADTFTIAGSTSGATAASTQLIYYRIDASDENRKAPGEGAPVTISWSEVPGAVFYNVFKEFGRLYSYVGSTASLSFVDRGIVPDSKDNPAVGISPFRNESLNGYDYPRAIGLFQQRLFLGGFDLDNERVVASHVGNYDLFDPGASDADGVDFVLAGKTVSNVQHIVEIAGRSVALTDTCEWVIKGGTGGGITPTAINARVDSYYGCSEVSPVVIGNSLIYIQRGDKIIRDAKYDYAQEALTSADITLWSKHLFKQGIRRMAYNRSEQVLWCLLNDGKLVAITYVPEQNIWGWHRHDIAGRAIEDICIVSESGQDRLYVACVSGSYLEIARLPTKWETEIVDDHLGFDMCLTYNGAFSDTFTAVLSGGSLWTTAETLTLTLNSSAFVVGDVGKDFLLWIGDDNVQVTCSAYTSGTVISVIPRTIVPTALRGTTITGISACASTFSGLGHLEGSTVGVICDNGREPDAVVASGSITLSRPFSRVQAGIPITADIQTLDMEVSDEGSSLGTFKHITKAVVRVVNTRGIKVGINEALLESLYPEYSDLVNAAPMLQSGSRDIIMSATHEDSGSVLVRQDTGLPASVTNLRLIVSEGKLN